MAKDDDAASKRLAEETAELVEYLLSIMNDEDNPALSAIDNKRRRYARILWALRDFVKIDHDELSDFGYTLGVWQVH